MQTPLLSRIHCLHASLSTIARNLRRSLPLTSCIHVSILLNSTRPEEINIINVNYSISGVWNSRWGQRVLSYPPSWASSLFFSPLLPSKVNNCLLRQLRLCRALCLARTPDLAGLRHTTSVKACIFWPYGLQLFLVRYRPLPDTAPLMYFELRWRIYGRICLSNSCVLRVLPEYCPRSCGHLL